jgi:hypothetical protein
MLLLTVVSAGCSGETTTTAIAGGDYQFFTVAADDACLDGALEAIFMPAGPATAHPFEFPVFLPGQDATPATYDVSFREPFVGMTVTVDSDGDNLVIANSVIDAVRLDADRYGDCDVTISIDADIVPAGTGTASGEAVLSLSNARGSEDRCPAFDADPCQVTLTLRAELQ